MEIKLTSNRFTVIEARAEKGRVYATIQQKDRGGGIRTAILEIDCGSAAEAADWLSYFYRHLDLELSLKRTYNGG